MVEENIFPPLFQLLLFHQRIRQWLNAQLACRVVAYAQVGVGVEVIVEHGLHPHRTVVELAGGQNGAGTTPVLTQL